jgi:type IV pilus assembly protein PilM
VARRSAIGLDIGTSGVRAAELSFRGQGVTLEKFGQVALPEGAVSDGEVIDAGAVTEAIRHLWSATRFSHKKVILGVANQRVVVRQVELPQMAPADLKKALPFQVQDYLPMPVDQAVLDFHPVESVAVDGAPHTRGLLVAASREAVMANVRAVQAAGLMPQAVDLTSFAVLRALATTADVNIATEALVDIGARVTNIVVHSNGVPRFVRILLMGGQDVTDAIAEKAGLGHLEAEGIKQQMGIQPLDGEWANASRVLEAQAQTLVDEVRGSLDYYASANPDIPVQRVVISGGGSKLGGLAERLAMATRRDVMRGNPTGHLQIGDTGLDENQLATVQPLAAVPVGLALGAV